MTARSGLVVLAALGVAAWWPARRYLFSRGWALWPALALLVLLPVAVVEVRAARFEARLAAAATPVSGSRGAFACERVLHGFWRSSGRPGEVWFDADGRPVRPAWLSGATCAAARRQLAHPSTADLQGIVALHTIVHEAAHLAGVREESLAECSAIAHDLQVWQRLGLPRDVGEASLARYRAEVRPRLPDEYQGTCPQPAVAPAG